MDIDMNDAYDSEGWAEVARRASMFQSGDEIAAAIELCLTPPCSNKVLGDLLESVFRSPHSMVAVFEIWKQQQYSTREVLGQGLRCTAQPDRLREFLETIPNHEHIEASVFLAVNHGGPNMEAKVDVLIAAGYDPKYHVVQPHAGVPETALDMFWSMQGFQGYEYFWPYSDTLIAKLS